MLHPLIAHRRKISIFDPRYRRNREPIGSGCRWRQSLGSFFRSASRRLLLAFNPLRHRIKMAYMYHSGIKDDILVWYGIHNRGFHIINDAILGHVQVRYINAYYIKNSLITSFIIDVIIIFITQIVEYLNFFLCVEVSTIISGLLVCCR